MRLPALQQRLSAVNCFFYFLNHIINKFFKIANNTSSCAKVAESGYCARLESVCPQGLLGSNPGLGVLFLSSVARKPLRVDKGRLSLCGNPGLGVKIYKVISITGLLWKPKSSIFCL